MSETIYLVTGAAGFLGSTICRQLVERGDKVLGLSEMVGMVVGVIIGIIGIVLMAFAYPVYNKVIKKEREKIAPEILRLTEELMK